jgi:hypothetical protein
MGKHQDRLVAVEGPGDRRVLDPDFRDQALRDLVATGPAHEAPGVWSPLRGRDQGHGTNVQSALPATEEECYVSEQEQRDESQTDEEVQDLDVPEEQTDDVAGGKKRYGQPEGMRGE